METKKTIKDSWPIIRSKLKFRYPELSNTDLAFQNGKEEEMLKNLQIKTGINRDQLLTEINTLLLEA